MLNRRVRRDKQHGHYVAARTITTTSRTAGRAAMYRHLGGQPLYEPRLALPSRLSGRRRATTIIMTNNAMTNALPLVNDASTFSLPEAYRRRGLESGATGQWGDLSAVATRDAGQR